jgi:hypothetical protein
MKPIPVNPQTLELATNIIWFEEPEQALADPVRFMAYAMTYALPEDMRAIRRYVSDDDFRDALDHAPPGIVDPRSWAYWNSKMGRYPAPPLPTRNFGSTNSKDDPTGTSRREGLEAWARMRAKHPPEDPEEVRRRAREEWRAKFPRKDQP